MTTRKKYLRIKTEIDLLELELEKIKKIEREKFKDWFKIFEFREYLLNLSKNDKYGYEDKKRMAINYIKHLINEIIK